MKTPFDAALRVEQRAIDAIRQTLIADLARQQQAADDLRVLEEHMAAELRHASDDWRCFAHPYTARLRPYRETLAETSVRIDAAVDRLRDEAVAAAARRRSVARAAAGFQSLWMQAQVSAEQSQADDFSGAQLFARRQPSRTGAGGR